MATDLIASIQRFVTPEVIGRIAAGLGEDKSSVSRAAAAAIPAILAGLAGAADRPEGAQKIANVLHQSSVTLDEVTGAFTGAEQRSIADHGAGVLSTLLGSGTTKSLAAAVADFAGLGEKSGKSILGMLAPVVLAVLGQRQRAAALDAGGIASLLAGQRNAIADALPLGFAGQLEKAGILDTLSTNWRGIRAGTASPGTAYYERNPAPVEAKGAGMSTWAMLAAALVAVAGMYWLLSGPESDEVALQEKPAEGRAVGTPGVSLASLTQQVTTSVAGVRSSLQDMAVSGSAEAALPKLRAAAAELDKLSMRAAQLPPESKKRIAALVSAAMPAINTLIEKVLADPAIAAAARPVIEPIRAKLASLAQA